MNSLGAQATGIGHFQRRVADVGVAVPGLGVHGVDGGEASGVGGRPASLDAVLARGKVVDVRRCVLIHPCEISLPGPTSQPIFKP